MARRGYNLLVTYLDDFLITAETESQCAEALNCLIQLLRELGFAIHWDKVADPTTKIIFLGIELDSIAMTRKTTWREAVQFTEWIALISAA